MTAREHDFQDGELAEVQAEEDRRRAEVNARTRARLRAVNAEYEGLDTLNPGSRTDDFWPWADKP